MTFVTLLRHGATEGNLKRILQGRYIDHPLTEVGRVQIGIVANKLFENNFSYIYSSPLKRAQESARIISQRLDISFETLPQLTERDFGSFEGLKRDELLERRKAEGMTNLDPTNDFPVEKCDVEPHKNVIDRWNTLVDKIEIGKNPAEEILMITHASFIRCVLYEAWGIEDNYPRAIKLREGSFLRLEWTGEGKLELHELWVNPVSNAMTMPLQEVNT